MSFHGRVSGTRIKRALGVQAALEWAFRVEQAQLDLPLPPDVTEEGFGFGLEYVLLQRAVLGCKIDGGQHKIGDYTHEDAEVIAATVAGIPDSLGGKRMAIRVAELARAGLTPDWMPGAVPRCVPTIVKQNQHGTHAGAVVVGTERIRVRGPGARATWKAIDILACPVTFSPHPQRKYPGAGVPSGWPSSRIHACLTVCVRGRRAVVCSLFFMVGFPFGLVRSSNIENRGQGHAVAHVLARGLGVDGAVDVVQAADDFAADAEARIETRAAKVQEADAVGLAVQKVVFSKADRLGMARQNEAGLAGMVVGAAFHGFGSSTKRMPQNHMAQRMVQNTRASSVARLTIGSRLVIAPPGKGRYRKR